MVLAEAKATFALLILAQVVPTEAVAIFEIQALGFLGRNLVVFFLHH